MYGCTDGNWHRKMRRANNDERKTTNDERNRPAKSRKNQNDRGKKYKYLGILDADNIKQWKKRSKKTISGKQENYRKLSYIAEITSEINTWVVSLVRYTEAFMKWTRENKRTRKLMTIHNALHLRDNIDRMHVKKKRRKRTCQHWR